MGKGKKITAWILLVLGLLVVYGTHIGIIAMGLPANLVIGHATMNLVAGVLITIGIILLAVRK